MKRDIPTRRLGRILKAALSIALGMALGAMPMASALADQVDEIPQASVPAPPSDTIEPGPARSAKPREVAPMPAGLGTLEEYEHQGDPSYRAYRAHAAGSSSNVVFDRTGNRQVATNDIILGALALGLFAMELHAVHRQHHHR